MKKHKCMLKKMRVFSIIIALCCIAVGVFCLQSTLKDLKTTNETYTFSGKILSYNYSQYNKNANYYLEANIDGNTVTLEISDIYMSKFQRTAFEKSYSNNNDYIFVASKEEQDDSGLIPIIGLQYNSMVFLNEQESLKSLSFNSCMGLIVSPLLLIAGVSGVILCCLPVSKRWFS